MLELGAIIECGDMNMAAAMLTAILTRILDLTASIKTIQTRRNYALNLGKATKGRQDRRNAAKKKAVDSWAQEDWRNYRNLRNRATASFQLDKQQVVQKGHQ